MGDKALMRQIAENKLRAFSIGTMGKRQLSKREIEEQRKREEEEAAAQAFEEFVATFQDAPNKSGKVWVKAGTYDAGKRHEDTKEKGKLYKPTSRLAELAATFSTPEKAMEHAKVLNDKRSDKPDRPGKKKEKVKKKSNLELFKEELRMMQEEREERHRIKHAAGWSPKDRLHSNNSSGGASKIVPAGDLDDSKLGSYDTGDPTTTNLYLGNLNPKITEQQLMEVFGKYGPLASIKIMWPRSDEEKARGRNCGFVAFMNRKDGERALKSLNGKEVMNYEMKLGWGKAVPIPPHPIYIPPAMMELTLPPPPSGLPFNAQPDRRDKHKVPASGTPYSCDLQEKEDFDKILSQAVVKVVIPTERNLLCLIHRMIEFVVREGPMFEAMIMNREINNPMFRFLFENMGPAHVYYRWKLFSILQGDLQNRWRTEEFRMFKEGSIWKPPPMNPYTQGMPEELVKEVEEKEPRKGSLSNTQRDRLEDILRNMLPERLKIAEAMVFCIEHSEAAEEVCECIAESLSILQTPTPKKIARMYLISDILHNCGVKVTNASYYRRGFETKLIQIFNDVHEAYKNIESRLKAEAFKLRVMQIFRAWEEWAIYPKDFLIRLQNAFLGITSAPVEEKPEEEPEPVAVEELDGVPLDNEDLDGVPLDGAALLKSALVNIDADEDIDGVPMEDDLDGKPLDDEDEDVSEQAVLKDENMLSAIHRLNRKMPAGFVPSRWETVDPEQVEAQAMTTSKWDLLDHESEGEGERQEVDMDGQPIELEEQDRDGKSMIEEDEGVDYDGVPMMAEEDSQEGEAEGYENREMNEERRAKLREIELKVMTYQDELESGQRSLKSGWNIQQQVEHYRRKLLRKAERNERERERDMERDKDPEIDRRESRRREKSERSERSERSRRSSSPDDSYYYRESSLLSSHISNDAQSKILETGSKHWQPRRPDSRHSRSKSKRSRSSSGSPPPKRSHRSRSRSPRKSRRSRSRSPYKKNKSLSRSPPPRKHKHKHKH